MLQDCGLPGILQDNPRMGTKWKCIKAHYVMHILRSIEGEVIDTTHPDFGRVQNIGLHDILSPELMNYVEKNGQVIYGGQVFQKKVDAGYCPLCMYSSQNHQMLNNHVRLHFCMAMFCGMPDCWSISHSAKCHAIKQGMVKVNTWVFILRGYKWHIHAGSWSLVNCWREGSTLPYKGCS